MQLFSRLFLFILILACFAGVVPSLSAAQPAYSPISGWFGSSQYTAAPLQPVTVNVAVSGYSGPATLLVFDGKGQPAGSWEFPIPPSGNTSVQVTPRGALGEHWAAMFIGDTQVANGLLYRLDAQTTVQTGVLPYDLLYPRVQAFLQNCVLEYTLNGQLLRGYRSPDSPLLWLRDHYYQGRGFRYFDTDVTSLLDTFRVAQQPDGSLPDFLGRPDHGVTTARTPVEADVEYLFVMSVYEAWQMTGNDEWMRSNLGAMQAAVNYTMSDPLRWEPSLGLVKRPFTIDTWDFEYGPTTTDPNTGLASPRHWIDDQTKWGIFHGDNTGLAEALNKLAMMEDYLGQPENATYHRDMAAGIMARLNQLSWNGSFYRHHVKLIPWDVPGVDEDTQLSLSNAYALNRGVLTTEQARAIIEEYRTRIKRPGNLAFAEWWSIDPPFPEGSFGMAGRLGESPGYYVNGGIMPLVGGELSRGAFRYGYEAYGFDILRRYDELLGRTGASYLWYHPTGGPGATGTNVLSTDGWGSSAMLAALMEGAAGVEDLGVRYSDVILSPRWSADPLVSRAYVVARYAASDGYVAYQWERTREGGKTHLKLQVTGSGWRTRVRLLLPAEALEVKDVTLNGQPVSYTSEVVGTSHYVVIGDLPAGILQIQVDVKP